jgi:heptosyltransferase-2
MCGVYLRPVVFFGLLWTENISMTLDSDSEKLAIHLDCRFFIGEKPCIFKTLCHSCKNYSPMGFRILIIKLGAMGDVLRTTPLLPALKNRYRESYVTWITDSVSLELLQLNPYIDRLLTFSYESILRLEGEKFDLMICLDKEPRASALAMKMQADNKQGFGLSKYGNVFSLNKESDYAFMLGIDDNKKFKENKKSYQEIIFEIAGLKYHNEEYVLNTSHSSREYAKSLFDKIGIKESDRVIGVSPGAGSVFANKAWTIEGYIDLIDKINNHGDGNIKIVLLGGRAEIKINKIINENVKGHVFDSGCENSLSQYIAIVDRCHVIVSGDTLAMHLGIGFKKQVLAIFGPTCPQEIELYGRGEKVVSAFDCAPCYKNRCDLQYNCMTVISAGEVYEKTMRLLSRL